MSIFEKMREKRRAKQIKNMKSVKKEYILNDDTPFNVTESFRNIKASLSVAVPKKEGKGISILMTSSFPEDGKTTISANLALMFAHSNAKVLIIDADIRKGKIAKFMKSENKPGLSDYLSGQATLEEIIQKTEIHEKLYFIPCGTHSPKPYELLESERMKELSEKLKAQFDYLFFDTPPVLVVSDALALAPVVDGAVLVCRHLVSYVSDIEKSVNMLNFVKINILGTVINDYQTQVDKYYGGREYYRKKGYYKKYGYGEKKKD
jgi:capsular exopolysaccharide synthesis family protein